MQIALIRIYGFGDANCKLKIHTSLEYLTPEKTGDVVLNIFMIRLAINRKCRSQHKVMEAYKPKSIEIFGVQSTLGIRATKGPKFPALISSARIRYL
jgi:hypothetical protein